MQKITIKRLSSTEISLVLANGPGNRVLGIDGANAMTLFCALAVTTPYNDHLMGAYRATWSPALYDGYKELREFYAKDNS